MKINDRNKNSQKTGFTIHRYYNICRAISVLLLLLFPSGCIKNYNSRDVSFKVNPSFSLDQLADDTRIWYGRFWLGINNPDQRLNWSIYASSDDLYSYGRRLNAHITSLLLLLRVTGDPALLDEIDRLAELMRAQLKDWSVTAYNLSNKPSSNFEADGYLNWQYLYEKDGYYGSDAVPMEEMLAHSVVSAFAYAFYVNRDLDPRYAERSDFWLGYLKNHFEAKWRIRNNAPTGNFLEMDLTHPYIQFIRYHYYMYKMTGDQQYLTVASNRANIIKSHMIEINNGTAFVWDHRVTELNQHPAWGCQPFYYGRQTVMAAIDLSLENFSVFDDAFMSKMAGTIASNIMDNGAVDFGPDVCGGYSMAGLRASGYQRESQQRMSYTGSYEMVGAWDSSGKIRNVSELVHYDVELNPDNPQTTFISGAMAFMLLYRPL